MDLSRRTVLAALAGAAGCSAVPPSALAQSFDASGTAPADLSSIAQFDITWTFGGAHRAGRYAQGDWWVVGPVEVVGIDPPSRSGGRVMNGAMINPQGGRAAQGYDSSMYGNQAEGRYRDSLNVALDVSPGAPLVVPPGSSLISSISHREPGVHPQLRTAAVLTVVDAPPPDGAFRPPYAGSDKRRRWTVDQLRREQLRSLDSARGQPALRDVEDWFERPWIDHVSGWLSRDIHPSENMPDYGREIALRVGDAALMLNLDMDADRKETLLRRFVQLGIDFWGVAEAGGDWPPDGGHAAGRKFPIMFAGLLLGDETLMAISDRDVLFGEDAQTFYVEETRTGLMNGGHGAYAVRDRGLPEWGIRHATAPERDDPSWRARYRTCCTANAWVGMVLAAHVMGLREAWGHEALFDYEDRYMAADHRESWERSMSPWAGAMWDRHRADYPPVWGG